MKDASPQYAGFWIRFKAWLIDCIASTAVSAALAIVVGISLGIGLSLSDTDPDLATWLCHATGCVLGLLVYIIYFVAFESSKLQATPGKIFCHLKVTDIRGERLSMPAAAFRLFGKFLSGFLFGFGFIVCDFTEKHQALHDIIAHTLVIRRVTEDEP